MQWRSVHGEQVLYECFQCTKCTYNLVWRPQGSRPGKIKGGCNKLCWECKSKWRSNRAHTTFLTGAGSGTEPNTHDGGERILLLELHGMLIYSKLSRIMHGRYGCRNCDQFQRLLADVPIGDTDDPDLASTPEVEERPLSMASLFRCVLLVARLRTLARLLTFSPRSTAALGVSITACTPSAQGSTVCCYWLRTTRSLRLCCGGSSPA